MSNTLDPSHDPLLIQAGAAHHAAGTPVAPSEWPDLLTSQRAGLADLGGDFAVARSSGGQAQAAVDRFGMRSLCWRSDGDQLRFNTRADALASPGREIDPQAVFDYLYHHVIPSPRTIWRGVQRLPPAHLLQAERGKVQVKPYWLPDFAPQQQASFEQLAERFRSLLQQAVARTLDSSTAACFLSGGTDSSTVAGMAQREVGQVSTYSIGFDAEGYDEMAYARLAAKHFGCAHHEYYVTPADLVANIPRMAAHFDQPFGNSSVLPSYLCALKARGDGITRLLAGDGGDELFGGNLRYAKQQVFEHYERVPALLRSALLQPLTQNGLARSVPGLSKVASYVAQASTPLPARLESYNLLQRLGVPRVLTPAFLSAVDVQVPGRDQAEVWAGARASTLLDRHLAYDWRYTLGETDLPKVRQATELAGVSVGYPMLDQALVDFSLTLPTDYKLRGQQLRWFFKEALRGFLPDEIIAKKKQGFGLPFGVWATRDAGLRQLASDSLNGLARRGVVQPGFVKEVLDTHLAAHPGYYGEMVWILMMLEQWFMAHAPGWDCRD